MDKFGKVGEPKELELDTHYGSLNIKVLPTFNLIAKTTWELVKLLIYFLPLCSHFRRDQETNFFLFSVGFFFFYNCLALIFQFFSFCVDLFICG